MPTYRKRGDAWRVEVCVQGVRRSGTFDTKQEARAWAEEFSTRARESKVSAANRTLRDALKNYEEMVTATRRGQAQERYRLNQLRRAEFCDTRLPRITAEVVERWLRGRMEEVSVGTARRDFSLLRSVMREAVKWGWVSTNPCALVLSPSSPQSRTRRVSDEEVSRITEALGFVEGKVVSGTKQEVAVAVLLALETGMRAGDILRNTPDNTFAASRYLLVELSKNGDSRTVPLSRRAVEVLKHLREGRFHTATNVLSTVFWRVTRRLGIDDLRFHDMRHEALTRMSKKVDVLDLAKIAGHRDPRSLMVYYNPTVEELADRLG